jgi:hypothetical protein
LNVPQTEIVEKLLKPLEDGASEDFQRGRVDYESAVQSICGFQDVPLAAVLASVNLRNRVASQQILENIPHPSRPKQRTVQAAAIGVRDHTKQGPVLPVQQAKIRQSLSFNRR